MNIIQSSALPRSEHVAIDLPSNVAGQAYIQAAENEQTSDTIRWTAARRTYADLPDVTVAGPNVVPDSASTTPTASASVAATRWFGLLSNDAARGVLQEEDVSLGFDGGLLDPILNHHDGDLTPLQRATRIVDSDQSPDSSREGRIALESALTTASEASFWQASENISLLDREQDFFQTFLHRICPWV